MRLAAGGHALGEEFAVMDRAGRVQLPREFREALALTRRVRLALEDDHVEIRSDGEDPVTEPMVAARGLTRTYGSGPATVHALQDVSFDVAPGEMVASGRPLRVRQDDAAQPARRTRPARQRDGPGRRHRGHRARRRGAEPAAARLGVYVFQTFGLVPALTAAENVGVPAAAASYAGGRAREAGRPAARPGRAPRARVPSARRAVGRSAAASGDRPCTGRVARLLLADEPTGQLDAETGLAVMGLLRGLVESEGVTAVVSTHDPVMMALADRVLTISDGRLG